MFGATHQTSNLRSAFRLAELIYHATVRALRKNHGNALIGLLMNMMQTVVFVLAFFLMFSMLGLRGSGIRGDFLLYIMSGIFLYMTHTKAMSAVVGSEGPASPMMKHAPMNTIIAISAAALSSLYIQILSMLVVLGVYHVGITPVQIHQPIGAMGMVLLSWFSGVAVGMVLLAVKPWFPGFVQVASNVYSRANMIASGKMFVANQMPGYILAFFTWNPIFHTIDQCRGFVFINYNPHYSNIAYPFWFSIALLFIGLLGEFYTRKNASLSWQAKR
ncbi:ABC-type polysaccharide/polyol phosphate export permease [Aliiruegeria haliotis]|uniref:ABC-type polysaccharide/polyol phosphate export permease n=1 Tax=Aliiruegeria haliotis TaxID=1280846 RepID=A0A2T0RPD6_9RHOB|nr:ABC transporter permease [Aliiruegeria haliotis]PRY23055.1 ABC-type polysaccharide/polyol phosphate export permease [Aliiruegeria haliotis]